MEEKEKNSVQEELEKIIILYHRDKEKQALVKKSVDDYSAEIKKLMNELNITEFTTTDGLTAKITNKIKDSFNEDLLVTKLKELNLQEAIDTVEVPNMDKIEDLIYNGKLNASAIAECKTSKQIPTLTVKEVKTNNGE